MDQNYRKLAESFNALVNQKNNHTASAFDCLQVIASFLGKDKRFDREEFFTIIYNGERGNYYDYSGRK